MLLNQRNLPSAAGSTFGSYADRLLCLALDIGEGILEAGGEIHRVENTIERICKAYGAIHVEVFAITSLIVASVRMEDNSYSSQIRRVYNTANHLSSLENYNRVSRYICANTPSLEEVDDMIRRAKEQRKYPLWLFYCGSGLSAGAFTVLFGGSLLDAVAGTLIGLLLAAIGRIHSTYINSMAKLVLTSFVAGFLSYLSVWAGLGERVDMIMIGTIMLLIPGLAFGSAVRDLLCGDFLAGILKTVQSCLSAVLIAAGYSLSVLFLEPLIGSTGGFLEDEHGLWVQLIAAALGTIGFGLMFRARVRYMPVVALSGFGTYLLFILVSSQGGSAFLAAFIATLFTSLFAEISARVFRAPVMVFLTLGSVSIVPGGRLYYTMSALLMGEKALMQQHLSATLQITAGIAVGIVLVSVFTNVLLHFLAYLRAKKKERYS
ncbi:MAG: threonine/serine exporter family protein [Clostridia bacterium]|nr:threonine/serine exporter family protein [Clostridia bacterium]